MSGKNLARKATPSAVGSAGKTSGGDKEDCKVILVRVYHTNDNAPLNARGLIPLLHCSDEKLPSQVNPLLSGGLFNCKNQSHTSAGDCAGNTGRSEEEEGSSKTCPASIRNIR